MRVQFKKKETASGDVAYETQHGKLAAPLPIAESEEQLDEVGKRFKRRAINLSEDQLKELAEELFVMINDWSESRSALEQKLRQWNDLFEGVTEQTDFPWPGACSVHIPLPKIKAREIAATINRSTMRPVPFLTTNYAGPASLYDESKGLVREIESFLEDKIKNDTNVHQTLKDAIPVVYRDGTCPVQVIWETNYEWVRDWKLYDDPQEFQKDYQDADAAGLNSGEYNRILSLLGRGGKYEAEYEYRVATYDGPKAYLVPLIDFVHWPVFVPTISEMVLHGKRVWWTAHQLREKARCGIFKKEDVEEIIKIHGEHREDSLTSSRDEIEGIGRESGRRAEEYQFFELVYTTALTDEDKQNDCVRKYLVYYHHLSRKVLRVESYPIRKGKSSYFPLRFIRRDNRFLGMSLVDDQADLSMEADTLIRQMTNSRTITHVPSFKAKFTAKSTFDPSRAEFRFRPGVTFYMNDVNDVAQFDIRPVDLSGSSDQLMLIFQLIDMVTGSSSGLSGQSNPIDPRAPARKQQEMLRQSSNRIDDYVANLLPDFESIGQYIVELYYQFAPDRINYYTTSEDGQILQQEIDRSKLFNPNVKFKVNGTSVFINPELEYARNVEIYQTIGTDPMTAQNPRIRRKALERLLISARIDDEKSLLPTKEELPAAFTTDEQAQREAEDARNKEKLAAKLADAAAKRDHALELEQKKSDLEARNLVLESALDVATGANGEAAAGEGGAPPAPAPGAAPVPFPVAPIPPAGSPVEVNGAA